MNTSIDFDLAAVEAFNDIKMKSKHAYVIFRIDNQTKVDK